jgi:hypothetical protein
MMMVMIIKIMMITMILLLLIVILTTNHSKFKYLRTILMNVKHFHGKIKINEENV